MAERPETGFYRSAAAVALSQIWRVGLTFEADGCTSPEELGVGDDSRCLSFQIRGIQPRRVEVDDLDRDPGAWRDLSLTGSRLEDGLVERLTARRFEAVE